MINRGRKRKKKNNIVNFHKLIHAIKNNDLQNVRSLLQEEEDDERVDPGRIDNLALKTAIMNACDLPIIDELLKKKEVDPSVLNNLALGRLCCSDRYLDSIERLLQDERVNPADNNNYAVYCASCSGYLASVNRLLQDERVDPSDENNISIRYASVNGHLEVVNRLLQDKRVDPSADDNAGMKGAFEYNRFYIVNRLAFDHRTNDCSRLSKFRRAIYLHSLGYILPLFSPSFERVSSISSIDIVIKIIRYESALTSNELKKIYDIITNIINRRV